MRCAEMVWDAKCRRINGIHRKHDRYVVRWVDRVGQAHELTAEVSRGFLDLIPLLRKFTKRKTRSQRIFWAPWRPWALTPDDSASKDRMNIIMRQQTDS
jgi:hypothetical protein